MPEPKEYVFFCDESDRAGKFYSNFYGGVRISSNELNSTNQRLHAEKARLGLNSEVKWSKTDMMNVDRYIELMRVFFDEMRNGKLVTRIMFTQNAHVAVDLTPEQKEEEYLILYYQFLKHAFGLNQMPDHCNSPRLRLYLDEIGETKEKMAKFRGYVAGLARMKTTNSAGFMIDEADITEVRSHDHILMQCVDVVLGAMSFRLNDKHKEKLPGRRSRGKRTIAKERLYRAIHAQIRSVTKRPHFNIGISTGLQAADHGRWLLPYLHWHFIPKKRRFDNSMTKR